MEDMEEGEREGERLSNREAGVESMNEKEGKGT